MPKHGLRNMLDTLFPVGEAKKKTSEMIDRGLEALRAVRDARGFVTGNTRLVPSRLELRLAQARYDELAEMGAVRDIEYYFNDELMKDMTSAKMKTFGDHPVYVTIAADTALQTNEIYAAVLTPENDEAMPAPTGRTSEVFDRTSVLGEEGISAAAPHYESHPAAAPTLRLVVSDAGRVREVPLEGRRWIIGRRGTSGRDLAEGYRKVDVDLPTTVSREQVRLDLIGGDRLRIERIGKAPVLLQGGEELRAGENRLLPLGGTFVIDTITLSVVAR